MLTKIKNLIPGAILLLPAIALAQRQRVGSIEDLLGLFLSLLNNYIVPLIVAIAVVYFMWGVVQFVTAGGDEEKRTTGRNTMIYGIVAIFVILSVWGLVNILNGTFGTANQSNPQQLPNLPQPR